MSDQNKSCCAVSRHYFTANVSTPSQSSDALNDPQYVLIPAGTFTTGTDYTDSDAIVADGETVRQTVHVKPFYIAKTPVTNEQFAQFIAATNYKTEAETFGWSFVFHLFIAPHVETIGFPAETPWWIAVKNAYWRQPEGPGSTIFDRLDHPVVHISWNDAQAYAKWANKRLPTEIEWEYAASGGQSNLKFPWGATLEHHGSHHANVWQGHFPEVNSSDDGFIGTAPAISYAPNAFGLYTMIGNVWEWNADTFTDRSPHYVRNDQLKLIKGGSYLCHASYCNRYRIAARTFNTADSSTGHMGFRLAADA